MAAHVKNALLALTRLRQGQPRALDAMLTARPLQVHFYHHHVSVMLVLHGMDHLVLNVKLASMVLEERMHVYNARCVIQMQQVLGAARRGLAL